MSEFISNVFEELSRSITEEERQSLLKKIQDHSDSRDNPEGELTSAFEDQSHDVDILECYHSLSLVQRIIIFLKGIFSGKNNLELTEEIILKRLGRELETLLPGYFDTKNQLVFQPFMDELKLLQRGVKVLAGPVNVYMGSKKKAFTVALIHNSMPELEMEFHHAITKSGNPFEDGDRNDEMDDKKAFAVMKKGMEEGFRTKMEEVQNTIRQNVEMDFKALSVLKYLFLFPFESMIRSGLEKDEGTSFDFIKSNYMELCGILSELIQFPSKSLLEFMVLFMFNERVKENENPSMDDIDTLLNNAMAFRKILIKFYKKIPLVKLGQLFFQNIHFSARSSVQYDNWMEAYKLHWMESIRNLAESRFLEFRRSKIKKDVQLHFNMKENMPFMYYRKSLFKDIDAIQFEISMVIVHNFLKYSYETFIQKTVKQIYIDGDFYKDENRVELTECLNFFERCREKLRELDKSVSPDGNWGKQLSRLRAESMGSFSRKKRMTVVMAEADDNVKTYLFDVLKHYNQIASVLNGILYGEVGGRYDTIRNLDEIGGSYNKELRKNIARSIKDIVKVQDLLSTSLDIESKAMDK